MYEKHTFNIITLGDLGHFSKLFNQLCKKNPLTIISTRSLIHLQRKISEVNADLLIININQKLYKEEFSEIGESNLRTLAIIQKADDLLPCYKIGFDDVCKADTEELILERKIINLLSMRNKIEGRWILSDLINLDVSARDLIIDKVKVRLSPNETTIIKLLLMNDHYLSIEDIADNLSERSGSINKNGCRVLIHRLRKKIEAESGYTLIKNRRMLGYYLSL